MKLGALFHGTLSRLVLQMGAIGPGDTQACYLPQKIAVDRGIRGLKYFESGRGASH